MRCDIASGTGVLSGECICLFSQMFHNLCCAERLFRQVIRVRLEARRSLRAAYRGYTGSRAEAAKNIARGLLNGRVFVPLSRHLRVDQSPAPLHRSGRHDRASRWRRIYNHIGVPRVAAEWVRRMRDLLRPWRGMFGASVDFIAEEARQMVSILQPGSFKHPAGSIRHDDVALNRIRLVHHAHERILRPVDRMGTKLHCCETPRGRIVRMRHGVGTLILVTDDRSVRVARYRARLKSDLPVPYVGAEEA